MNSVELAFFLMMITAFSLAMSAELLAGRIQSAQRTRRDLLFNVVAFLTQPVMTGVFVAGSGAFLMRTVFPEHAGAGSHLSFWWVFPVVFFLNEFSHYWLHRFAHEWRWLWKLHRTHHSGMDMNATLIYRYNIFWPALVPQTWIGAVVMYFGQTEAFLAAAAITYLVNVGTHLSFRWDLVLRERYPATEPVWRILERVITLPDAHQA
ncbi:MAG: sterol desaturase family protein, partial [Halioglobus sp.]